MKLLLIWVVLAVGWNPFLHRESQEASKALKAYKTGDYVEALTAFKKAKDVAKDPTLYDFNLGVAAQRAQNPNAALGHYLKARESSLVSPGFPDYNMGNLLYEMEKPNEALAAFREALRADPSNEDARYNYEVLLKQMNSDSTQDGNEDNQSDSQEDESSESENEQNSPQDPENQGEQNPDNQNQQNQESQEGGESEEQQSNPQQASQDPATEGGDSEGGQKAQPVPLDKQQAERLLNALTQGERDLLKARLKGEQRKRAEKDW